MNTEEKNLAILGATGLAGKHILERALAHGHRVTVLLRNPEKLTLTHPKLQVVQGDAMNPLDVELAIEGKDAVLTAISEGLEIRQNLQSKGIEVIAEAMERKGIKRILTLCGMGILSDKDGKYVNEDPSYPALYLPIGLEHRKVHQYLKAGRLDWTIFCPPTILDKAHDGNFQENPEVPGKEVWEVNGGNLGEAMVRNIGIEPSIGKRIHVTNLE